MAKSNRSADEKKRTSLILKAQTFRKVKYISLKDEKDITDIVDDALNAYIEKWEKKQGPINI